MKGIVTDIQRFCIHDGPGIRTTVFLKGCNMRCHWCHNPEALQPEPELQLFPGKCLGCGACFEACDRGAHSEVDGQRVFRRERCQGCGECAKVCFSGALVLVGQEKSVPEVLEEVLADREFYESSGGGMTVSGGEPLFQGPFTEALLRASQAEGIHTAIESNMAWPWEHIEPILEVTDLVMMDIKHMDDDLHRSFTGVSNVHVLENARRLGERGVALIVRTPIIPGVNDSPKAVAEIARFVARLSSLRYYELLPYHPLGTNKYESLGMHCRMAGVAQPSRSQMEELAEVGRQCGIPVRIA